MNKIYNWVFKPKSRQCLLWFLSALLLSLLPFKAGADNQAYYKPEQYVPQSPNVAAMQAYVDRPVSLFNGTAQISIPLCEVNAMGINLPISLSYSSTGFRPSQEATWVGLGWNLSLNACISRNIKQMSDLLPTYGYLGHGKNIPMDVNLSALQNLGLLQWQGLVFGVFLTMTSMFDLEPDIFSYSIWNQGGKFVLDNQDKNSCKLFDISAGWKMKICPVSKNTNTLIFVNNRTVVEDTYYFELISPDGTHYYFKDREGTLSQSWLPSFSDDAYTSSWFLSCIETKEGQIINFLYDDEYYLSPDFTSYVHYNFIQDEYLSPCAEFVGSDIRDIHDYSIRRTNSIVQTKRLKEINWVNGKIRFYSSKREDIEPSTSKILNGNPLQKLDSICVFDANNHSIRRFEFRYGYFGEGDFLNKRLKLERIVDKDNPENSHSMEYRDNETFPAKNTQSVDYWGYYNGKVYDKPYCMALNSAIVSPDTNYLNVFKTFDGAVKYSDETKTSLGMLTSLSLPTGGKETFSYEPNEFVWYNNLEYVKKEAFLLDKTITLYHFGHSKDHLESCMADSFYVNKATNAEIRVQFFLYDKEKTYPAYDVFSIGSWHVFQNTRDSTHVGQLAKGWHQIQLNKIPDKWKGIVSLTIKVKDSTPKPVRTGKIKGAGLRIASISGGGKTRRFEYGQGTLLVHPVTFYNKTLYSIKPEMIKGMGVSGWIYDCAWGNYTVQVSESTIPVTSIANGYTVGYRQVDEVCENQRVQSIFYIEPESEIQGRRDPSLYFDPYISISPNFQNGKLLQKTTYDGDTCKMTELMVWDDVQTQKIPAVHLYHGGDGFAYNHSYTVSQNRLRSKTVRQYEGKDLVTSITTFDYNDLLLPARQTSYAEGRNYSTQDVYTCDATDSTSKAMTSQNLILPKETINLVDGRIVSGNKVDYLYDAVAKTYLPAAIFRLDTDKGIGSMSVRNYKETIRYTQYNADGKPVEMYKMGTPIVYLWSYNGQYPIAEIVNATRASVEQVLGMGYIESVRKKVNGLTESELSALRKKLQQKEVQVTTMTYKPMVGVSSITGPVGKTVYFGYDPSGRLVEKYYKDSKGVKEVIEDYEYKMKGAVQ